MRQVDAFSISSILATSIRFLGRNFAPVTLLVLLVGIPKMLVNDVFSAEGLFAALARTLTNEMLDGLLLALLSMAIFQSLCGKQLNLIETCRLTGPTLPSALLTSIVESLLIAVGTLLLVLPGIICLVLFFVLVPVAAVEGIRTKQALLRSAELVSGHGGRVFGLLLLYLAANAGYWFGLRPLAEVNSTLLTLLLDWGPQLILDAIFVIAASVCYYDPRYIKDDTHLDSMKEVFE